MISLNDVLLAMSNIPVDDPIAEIWGRGLQGRYKIIEYTGALPITITANGDALLDYRIYGDDSGVGEMTENLFDNRTRGYYNNGNGMFVNDPSRSYWKIPVQKGDIIYANNKDTMGWGCCFYKGTYVPYSRLTPSAFPYTVPDGVDEVTNNYPAGSSAMVTVNRATPTEYIPYGYKLPMTVGDGDTTQTVPVYIGENQLDAIGEYSDYADYGTQKIVRKIAKIELDGSESWQKWQENVYVGVPNYIKSVWGTVSGFSRSSHYVPSLDAPELGTYGLGGLTQYRNSRWNGNIVINVGMTTTEYKAYLASQAAAGTPVTFWYVVEIPVEQDPPVTLPEIPAIKGETVIDYDGDPKPSQMYVKYKGKSGGA